MLFDPIIFAVRLFKCDSAGTRKILHKLMLEVIPNDVYSMNTRLQIFLNWQCAQRAQHYGGQNVNMLNHAPDVPGTSEHPPAYKWCVASCTRNHDEEANCPYDLGLPDAGRPNVIANKYSDYFSSKVLNCMFYVSFAIKII